MCTYDIRGSRYCAQSTAPDVDGQCNDRSYERAELENCPEDTKRFALVLLQWVTHHNCTLCGP